MSVRGLDGKSLRFIHLSFRSELEGVTYKLCNLEDGFANYTTKEDPYTVNL